MGRADAGAAGGGADAGDLYRWDARYAQRLVRAGLPAEQLGTLTPLQESQLLEAHRLEAQERLYWQAHFHTENLISELDDKAVAKALTNSGKGNRLRARLYEKLMASYRPDDWDDEAEVHADAVPGLRAEAALGMLEAVGSQALPLAVTQALLKHYSRLRATAGV